MYKLLVIATLILVSASSAMADDTGAPRLEPFHQALAETLRSRVSLSAAEQAWLDGQPVVNIRIGPVPPFHFVDGGEPQGISVDYLKVVCEAFALRCRFLSGLPWHEGLARFKAGNGVDLLPTVKRTPEREAYTLFSRDYLDAPWVIFTRNTNRFVGSVDDLRDQRVAVERSFVIHRLLEKEHPEIALLPVKDSLNAILAVATGQADAYIGNLMTGNYLAQRHGLSNIKIAAPTDFGTHNLAFGIQKGMPELASIIDKSLAAFTRKEIGDIQDRWLTISYEGVDWGMIRQIAAIAAVLVLLLLLSFAYWNRKLQLEILQRKETEQALSQSEQQLAGIVESADEAIISIDEKQRVLLFNRSAEDIFGYHRDEVIGQPLDMLLPEEFRERHRERVAQFLGSGSRGYQRDVRGRMFGRRKDGGGFPMEAGLSKQRMHDQTIMTVALRDLSAKAKAEEEKQQLQRQLLQAQKMEAIGQLTGGIAHDFNNILAAILGNTELATLAASKLDDAPKLLRYLSQIEISGQRARELVAKMLAFSRGSHSERQPLALQAAVEEALDMLDPILPSSIQVHFDAAANLPDLQADPVQINQVVTNLCINARDAMNKRGKLDITLRKTTVEPSECLACHELFSGDFLELAVRDSGEGIPADMLDRIFDPFFTTKNVGQGSGMGLSMIHGIMHDHGGHILVDSQPGKGATFRLLFPVEAQATVSTPHHDSHSLHGGLIPATSQMHILVVDDETALLDFETELLSSLGYQVTGCDSSEQARELLQGDQHFDLLLTDQTMPGLTGLELAEIARERRPEMPVVLVSGYSSELSGDGLHSAQISAFVNKPFDSAQLSSLLSELLG